MNEYLPAAVLIAGCLQLSVLVASALVPLRLDWKNSLAMMPRLHRQLYWTYGGYIVLAIIASGLICIFNHEELAGGSRLARSVCGYLAIFWGVRLSLQPFLDVKRHLTTWWLHAGYHVLTVLFASFAGFFAFVALR